MSAPVKATPSSKATVTTSSPAVSMPWRPTSLAADSSLESANEALIPTTRQRMLNRYGPERPAVAAVPGSPPLNATQTLEQMPSEAQTSVAVEDRTNNKLSSPKNRDADSKPAPPELSIQQIDRDMEHTQSAPGDPTLQVGVAATESAPQSATTDAPAKSATVNAPGDKQNPSRQKMLTASALLTANAGRIDLLANATVHFAPTKSEQTPDPVAFFSSKAERQVADRAGSSFVGRNAGLIRAIVSEARAAVPTISAQANLAARRMTAQARRSRSSIARQINQSRSTVHRVGTATSGRVSEQTNDRKSTAQETSDGARQNVETAFQDASSGVEPLEIEQRGRIASSYETGDLAYRNSGSVVGEAAVGIGREYARDWLGQRDGESSILDGPIHDNRLEAKADAAIQVGQAYQQELEKVANEQADAGLEGEPKDLESVTESGQQCRDTLEGQWLQADEYLKASAILAEQAISNTSQPLISGARRSTATSRRSLAQQLEMQDLALQSYESQQVATLHNHAETTLATILESAAVAVDRLSQPLHEYARSASTTPAPNPHDLHPMQSEMDAVMHDVVAQVFSSLSAGQGQTQADIRRSSMSVSASMSSLGDSGVQQANSTETDVMESLERLLGQATKLLSDVLKCHVKGVEQQDETATDGFDEVVVGIETLFDRYGINLDANFEKAAAELEKSLRKELEKEPGVIEENADKAAAEVQPRWKKVLKVLLVIVVIVVVALVVGPAVIGFVGAAAGTLGAGAATATAIGTIVGGAIVGAASGATIQLGNNIIDGKDDLLEGVGKAAVVGAISGAIGGFGSAVSGGIGGSLGAVSQTIVRGGINLAFDTGGGIVADLVVGNDITLTGVLTGAAIGMGVSAAGANLARFGAVGRRASAIQSAAFNAGSGAGMRTGSALRAAFVRTTIDAPTTPATGITPASHTEDVSPKIEEPQPAPTRSDEPEAIAPRAEEPEPAVSHVEEPEPAVSRIEEPEPAVSRVEEPEPVAPRAEEPEAVAARTTEPEPTAPRGDDPEQVPSQATNSEPTQAQPGSSLQPGPRIPPEVEPYLGRPMADGVPPGYAQPYKNKSNRWIIRRLKGRTDLPILVVDGKGNIQVPRPVATGAPRTTPLPAAGSPKFLAWLRHRWGDPSVRPCFPAGTLVHTPQGLIPIEAIKPQQVIIAFDFAKAECVEAVVDAIQCNWTNRLALVKAGPIEIHSTTGHLFWIDNEQRWCQAAELKPEMRLRLISGSQVTIDSVQFFVAEESTYTFSVVGYSNYFVGTLGILVHNESGFADTSTRSVGIYGIRDRSGRIVYVGQTTREFTTRFREHLENPSSALRKALADVLGPNHPLLQPGIPDADLPRLLQTEFTVVNLERHRPRTKYEAAVLEQHHIDRARRDNPGLTNLRNEITASKYERYKHLHNPC